LVWGCLPWRRARSSTRPTLASPKIDPGNSLRHPLREIGDKDRVDVILTNPPCGGEEERGIQNNFPIDKQTSETALLFLQLIMRKLRRHPNPGRAGVLVPNGTLFAGGGAARIIKKSRLKSSTCTPSCGSPTASSPLHQHPDEPALLRPQRPDGRSLVLRAAFGKEWG
jgi:hypothetical protein